MVLNIKNVGKLKSANVEFNGITVIAGENDTGKSTVGKMLFCIFNSLYKIEERIDKERALLLKNEISDNEILTAMMKKIMEHEFNMQINNFDFPEKTSEIEFKINDSEAKIKVENNANIFISNNINLDTESIYIDDPYVLDINSPNYFTLRGHRGQLRFCLNKDRDISVTEVIDELITTKRLAEILEKLNSVCPGEMIRKDNSEFAYKETGTGKLIDAVNMSAGLKTFAIIKTLLLNGSLQDNGVLILDEPEIHLHPKWQLIFAELIVLIQKEFSLRILLNTHSPYFLNAIEVYSRKNGISNKCKYYLAEASDDGMSEIFDVSDDIARIYEKLVDPIQDLEDGSY